MEGGPEHATQGVQGDEPASAGGASEHITPEQLLEPMLSLIDSFISLLPNPEHRAALKSLPPETLLLLCLGAVALLLSLLLRLLSRRKSALAAPVVLAGPCGSGKTGGGGACAHLHVGNDE